MRRFERRVHLALESLESKVVPTLVAPLPHIGVDPAAGAEVGVERAIARPMAVNRDTVHIQNNTGFHIHVTARLMVPEVQKPTISRQIRPNGAVEAFSFGRNRDDFIAVEIRAVGRQAPPPLAITLDKPISGYHGMLFRVNMIGGYFNVRG
ncbi:MAG: hypothetical protein ACYC61_13885 [Isosphaeraceae bacterium]